VEALAREGQPAQTLRSLISQLAEEAGPEKERAGPEVTRLIAETIAPEAELAELVDSGLGVLRKLGVSASELSTLKGSRARLFGQALERADAALHAASLRDERGDAWLAAGFVHDGVLASISEVVVSAWPRLGSGELTFLERLHDLLRRRGGGVSVRFPGLSGEESRRAVESEQARLEARWADLNDAPAVVRDDDKPVSALDFRATRAPNLASEARAVVRAVQECVSRGGRLDRIAIVPLELSEAFLEELRSALWTAGLPFSEPRGRPPIAGPNVHATLELLRLVGGPIRRDALLDVLAAPGLRPERWFGEAGKPALGALRELLARTPVGFDRDGSLLLSRVRFLAEQRPDERRRAAVAGLGRLLDDLRALAIHKTRAELVRELFSLVDSLGLLRVAPRVLGLALESHAAGSRGLLNALSDDARGGATLSLAFSRLLQAAERLGLAAAQVSPRELSAELHRAMEGAFVGRGAARAAAIAIARPAEVAGLPLDLAVVCRASAASFSKAGGSPSTLWLGAELCETLPRSKRPPSGRDEEAALLTALNALLTSARQVELVWSTLDGNGETRESRFVEALLAASPGQRPHDEPGSPLSAGARRLVPLSPPSPDARLRAEVELARQAFFFGQGAPSELVGQVSDLSAWVGPARPPLPVTRLERYADCPFLGFASVVLRAARDESVSDALGARERGILIHAAVAEALTAIAGLDRPEDELLELALAAADRTLSLHGGSALRGSALRTTRGDVRSLVRWSLQNREYAFQSAEKGFGEGEVWGPLELGSFRLSGRIDRVDVSTDGKSARVIDYKSGQPPSRSERHALQGVLYARKVMNELGVDRVQSLYLGLSRRVPVPREIWAGAADDAELAERERFALGLLTQLQRGHVPAEPTRPARCVRCDARELCRRPLSAPSGEDTAEET
jgi:ATP-dependent helicase/nuclease subunit B